MPKKALVPVIVLGLLGVLLGLVVLVSRRTDAATATVSELDGRVIRNEVRIEAVQEDIHEIKDSQHSIEAKLDRVIERMP